MTGSADIMTNRKLTERQSAEPVVYTGAEIFPGRAIVDLIAERDGKANFIVWDGKCEKAVPRIVHNGSCYLPLFIDPSIMRSLHLPRSSTEYGSTRKLFDKVSSLISRVTQAGGTIVQLLTFFVFATWLGDTVPVAPFLWIVSPPTTTSALLEQVLSLLCRRAFIVNHSSLAEFYSLALDLEPSLLIRVLQPTRRSLDPLRILTRRGAFTAASGRVVDASRPMIVFATEPLRDASIAGFPLELVLPPTRHYIPPMSASEAEQIVAEYQSELLRYRFQNLEKVGAPAFDISQFSIPMQEIAYSLTACIVDDNELQVQIVPLLKPVDSEIRVGIASGLKAIGLEALLARCHTVSGKYFPVIDITKDVNTVLAGRGEVLEVSPEKVGWMLVALGFRTEFISGGRRGLVLSNKVREKIHELAASYGVRTLREVPAKIECPLCAALELPWMTEAASGSR